MKVISFISLLLISLNLFSQSKGDTQAWIKSTIENYASKSSYQLLNIYFTNDAKSISVMELVGKTIYYEEMPIKQINQVFIKESQNGSYVLTLLCSYDKRCCESGTYENTGDGTARKVPSLDPKKGGVTITLSASIKNDNLISRLKKALTHLITLNGGKTISDTF